jgi:hypothetical protein
VEQATIGGAIVHVLDRWSRTLRAGTLIMIAAAACALAPHLATLIAHWMELVRR